MYYTMEGKQTPLYIQIGRKAGISRNYMVKATVKVGGDTYTSGFKSNYAYKMQREFGGRTKHLIMIIIHIKYNSSKHLGLGYLSRPIFIHFFKERAYVMKNF